jgi:predicted negative regulator of RcsB-dependent stress response
MPRAIKKKTKKKDVAAEIDVKDKFSDISNLIREKQKTFLTYGIAAVIVILAVMGFLIYNYMEKGSAGKLEYEAYKVFYNEYETVALPDEERYQKALELFEQAYGKHKSPRLLLYIAHSYDALGKQDEALKTLDEMIRKYPAEKDLVPLAYQKAASIHIARGNTDEALKTLDALYQSPGPVYKDYALIESARILDKQGKKDEAIAKYRELTQKFMSSPFLEEAKSRLASLAEKKENG